MAQSRIARSVRRRSISLALCLSLGLAFAGQALAQNAEESQSAPTDAAERERKARALYEKGVTHYNLAEYDQAIEAYKEAYVLTQAPLLLYNIAVSYRQKGDCANALKFYKNYLRVDPGARNRAAVEGRMTEMEKCVKEHPPAEEGTQGAAPPAPPVVGPVPSPQAPPPPPSASLQGGGAAGTAGSTATDLTASPSATKEGRSLRIAGITTAAVGGAILIAGIYFALQAKSASDEVAGLFLSGGMWSDHYQMVQNDGQGDNTKGLVLISAGAVTAGVGGLLYYLGHRKAEQANGTACLSPARLSAAPIANGVAMAWSCGF